MKDQKEVTLAPTKDENLIDALTAELNNRANHVLNSDPQWSRLAGAVDALSGRYELKKDPKDSSDGVFDK